MRTPSLALGADGGELLNRIRRLIAPQSVIRPRVSGGFAMSVVFTIALLALNAHVGSSSVAATPPALPVVQSPASVRPVAPDEARQAVIPRTAVSVIPAVRPAQPPRVVAPAQNAQADDQAQIGTGGLVGVVRDQTGGVIPGARVNVTSVDASIKPAITTDVRGEFFMTDLPAGAYELAVSLPGFRTSRNTIQITAGQTVTVIVRLDVGSLMETVTVQSPAGPGRGAASLRQPPANPQTAEDYFDAAKILYAQGRFDEAVAMNARALALLRAATPEIAPAAAPEIAPATVVFTGSTTREGQTTTVRVGGAIKEPRKIRHVPPIYPADAVAAGVEGVVALEAIIATDGTVKNLTVLRSVPMLDEAALTAVRLWGFTPTLLNGVPVEVVMTVTVNFVAR
jgi:TonB family protein